MQHTQLTTTTAELGAVWRVKHTFNLKCKLAGLPNGMSSYYFTRDALRVCISRKLVQRTLYSWYEHLPAADLVSLRRSSIKFNSNTRPASLTHSERGSSFTFHSHTCQVFTLHGGLVVQYDDIDPSKWKTEKRFDSD